MIPWFQCTVFELKAIVRLPAALRTRVIEAREHQLARELDVLPGFSPDELSELERRGVQTNLRSLCPRLLSDRERQSRTKTKAPENLSREPHATLTTDERDAHAQRREEKSREEERSIQAAPAKPKRKPKAVQSFDSWMPKEDHIAIAKERNLNLAAEHIAMGDWLASTGRTYKDYDAFARNWLRRATPQRAMPVNTGNYLRQPHPRTIPTDPDEARKYWLGEETNEPRFDFG